MQWYYADKDSAQQGPITEEEIIALINGKKLDAGTKVWNETLPAWQQLAQSTLATRLEAIRFAPVEEVKPMLPTPPPLNVPPVEPVTPPPPVALVNWFYMQGSERKGPASETEMEALIANGSLKAGTQVWNASFTNWQALSSTRLADKLPAAPPQPPTRLIPPSAVASGTTPVLPVSNIRVWVLAFLPLVGMVHDPYAWVINLVLNLAVSYRDSSQLAKAGYNTAELGSAWLIPVYLWKRAALLQENNAYFWVWCALFLLSLGI